MNTAQILDAFAYLDHLESELALVHTLPEADRADAAEVIERDIDMWLTTLADATLDKLDALVWVIDRADGEARIAKVHEDRAATRRRRANKVRERCLGLAERLMRAAADQGIARTSKSGVQFVDTGSARVSLVKTPPSVRGPESIEQWPEAWRVPQPDRPNKAAASKALKAGKTVEGFALVQRETVRIKP